MVWTRGLGHRYPPTCGFVDPGSSRLGGTPPFSPSLLVRTRGLEPPRIFIHTHLKRTRIPFRHVREHIAVTLRIKIECSFRGSGALRPRPIRLWRKISDGAAREIWIRISTWWWISHPRLVASRDSGIQISDGAAREI